MEKQFRSECACCGTRFNVETQKYSCPLCTVILNRMDTNGELRKRILEQPLKDRLERDSRILDIQERIEKKMTITKDNQSQFPTPRYMIQTYKVQKRKATKVKDLYHNVWRFQGAVYDRWQKKILFETDYKATEREARHLAESWVELHIPLESVPKDTIQTTPPASFQVEGGN